MALSEDEIFFLLLLFDDNDSEDLVLLHVTAMSSLLPYRLDCARLHSSSLLPGGADYFFQHADSSSLKKVCCLNSYAFNLLHDEFLVFWKKPMSRRKLTNGHLPQRALSSHACLGLTLHWLAHGPTLTSLCMFIGKTSSTASRYLNYGLQTLFDALQNLPSASVTPPSPQYLMQIGNSCGSLYGDVMTGCALITDGSIHPLEKDERAQWNFFDEVGHPGESF